VDGNGTGGPHNAVFVVWGISNFDAITLPTQANPGLEWSTQHSIVLRVPTRYKAWANGPDSSCSHVSRDLAVMAQSSSHVRDDTVFLQEHSEIRMSHPSSPLLFRAFKVFGGWLMIVSAHLFIRSLKSMSYCRFKYIKVYIF
jgi:hypothetical protein